jgi:fibronectin-binding autotransporter adhesin
MQTSSFAVKNPSGSGKIAGRILLIALLALIFCPRSAFAQGCTSPTFTWSGGASGSWNTTTNWTPNGTPSTTSNTCINTASSAVNVSNGSTGTLQLGLSTDSLSINDNSSLTVAGSSIQNAGTITINSTGDNTFLDITGSTTLSGTGTLTMSNHIQNFIQGGGTLTNQSTIQGSGQIGNGNLTLINSGTIDANQATELLINPNGGTTNSSLMEATAGGTLEFRTDGVTNTGGTILATGNNSIVDLNGISVTNGTLNTASGGLIQAYGGATLTTLTISGTVNVLDNNTVNLGAGTITNNGVINENSTGDTTELSVAGSTTLSGTGTLTMSNHAQNYILGGGTLTNDETIQGSGVIGNGNLTLVNNSIIDANQSNELLINPNGGTTNTKTMEATAGGTMEFRGDTVTNTGVGTILASGTGSVVDLNGVTVNGGTLTSTSGGLMQAYGGAVLNGVTISTGSAVHVVDNQTVQLNAGTITNNGTINIDSTGDTTQLQILGGAVTLTGGGNVVLSDRNQNYIQDTTNGTTLTNVNNTISGSGNIGNGNMGLINDAAGIVDAVSASGNSLVINSGSAGTANVGLMEASGGGTLVLDGTVTNTGTIDALAGGVVNLNGTDLIGGTLTSVGTGFINAVSGAILDGSSTHPITLTAGSNLFLVDNQSMSALGTLTNNGTLTINSTGDNTIFNVGTGNTLTLTGTGILQLSNHTQNYIQGGGTLINQETIQGSGNLGNGNLILVNNGTIDANQSNSLTINPNGGTTNTKTMEATAGGTLIFSSFGITNTGGTILASGTGSIVDLNDVSVTGGTLSSASGGIFQAYNSTSLNSLTISAGTTLNVLDNQSISLGAGTITNNGTINENSTGDNTFINITGATTLAGTGSINMSAHTQNYIQGGGTLTNQETIQGSGNLGNGDITLVNNGIIDANQSAASLTIDANGGATNTKTLEATAGGTLIFLSNSVTNTGTAATILATGTGSIVDFNDVAINGGTLTTSSGGLMQAYDNTLLNGITLSSGSTLNVLDNNTVDINGTITNKGTINENSTGDNTFITLVGNTTLTTPGKLVLSAHSQNYINGSFTLTNQGTISGEGHIGNGDLTLVNTGSILANETGTNAPSTLLIDTGAGGFSNSSGTKNGILNVSAKNTLIIEGGPFSNMNTTTGTLTGGVYDATGTLEFAAGTMGIVTNDATIALTSATGAILNTSESNASALSGFTTNGTKGSFSVASQKFTDANDFTNQGTLTAGSGGTIDLTGGLTNFDSGTDTLTGGTYNVTGTLEFQGADIVVNNANITITGNAAKIENSTGATNALLGFNDNKGTFTVNGGTFTDANSFTNTGTLAAGAKGLFNASGGLTNFNNTNGTLTGGSYTLTTTGQIQFNNETFANDIVTNDAKITLAGVDTTVSPFIDQNGTNALANFATNGASGSFFLTTDRVFTNTGSLTNAGIVNVGISSGTGKTELIIGGGGSYTQTGGTTTVDGVLSASGGINIQGGFLYGTALTTTGTEGTLIGNVDLSGGTINPGNAVKLLGTLDITGTFAESGSGILNIDLDGTTPGTKYDVLNVSGAAALGGTIDFVLNAAFKPVVGDTWDVLNYASETGSFTTVNLPTAPTGDHYVFSCGLTDCTLTLDAGPGPATSASNSTVSASPAKRVTREMGSVASASNTHEPLAILSLATCSAARMFVSMSCGDRAAATLSHSNELHSVASVGSGLGAVHNNVMAATTRPAAGAVHNNVMTASTGSAAGAVHNNVMVASRSISSARGGSSDEPTASASAMAKLYVCAYLPSTLAHNMGCN